MFVIVAICADSEPDCDDETVMFSNSCISNLTEYLQKGRNMTKAATKEFISKRVSIDVEHACYGDSVRTVTVRSEIEPNRPGSSGISLWYEYHNRARMWLIEHCEALLQNGRRERQFLQQSLRFSP